MISDSLRPLTSKNIVTVFKNGEEKFPDVFSTLEKAEKFIHIEYFIIENDHTCNRLKNILIKKVKEGVKVRVLYDDFGSRNIRKTLVAEMQAEGVEIYPFFPIKFPNLANRINYRDHRKIIIVDGHTGYLGGINFSDKYDNRFKNEWYWRDTHFKLEGSAVNTMQYLFLTNWNFCCKDQVKLNELHFPRQEPGEKKTLVQIAGSGPDSLRSTLMYSLLAALYSANEEICITTPYFIPNESVNDAIKNAALGGVKVKLLVPGISDTYFVKNAAKSYYSELLVAGVEIFQYKKGFVHAKTITIDKNLSIVGTANMDIRSFELNFEINAFIYDQDLAQQLRDHFYQDLKDSETIVLELWKKRGVCSKIKEAVSRLFSPIL